VLRACGETDLGRSHIGLSRWRLQSRTCRRAAGGGATSGDWPRGIAQFGMVTGPMIGPEAGGHGCRADGDSRRATPPVYRNAILTHPTMTEGLNALFAAVPAVPRWAAGDRSKDHRLHQWPEYDKYQAGTKRDIPVVLLSPRW